MAFSPLGIGMARRVLLEVTWKVLKKEVQTGAVLLVLVVLKLAGSPVVLLMPNESRRINGVALATEAAARIVFNASMLCGIHETMIM
jgi:hypothetical protein